MGKCMIVPGVPTILSTRRSGLSQWCSRTREASTLEWRLQRPDSKKVGVMEELCCSPVRRACAHQSHQQLQQLQLPQSILIVPSRPMEPMAMHPMAMEPMGMQPMGMQPMAMQALETATQPTMAMQALQEAVQPMEKALQHMEKAVQPMEQEAMEASAEKMLSLILNNFGETSSSFRASVPM